MLQPRGYSVGVSGIEPTVVSRLREPIATWASFGVLCCAAVTYVRCALAETYVTRIESVWLGDGLIAVAFLLLVPRLLSRYVTGPFGQTDDPKANQNGRTPLETFCITLGLILYAIRTYMRWQSWFYLS